MKANAACQEAVRTVGRATSRDRLRLAFLWALAGAARPLVPGWPRRPVRPGPGAWTSRPLGDAPRILVVRPDHLGDLLFVTPALQGLREMFPAAHITALVGPWGRDIMARNPTVNEVRTCPFPYFDRQPKSSLLAPYRLLRREAATLRAAGFDAALNLRPDFWWGAALLALARIPVRVGYDVPACRPFLTTGIACAGAYHDVERNLALMSALTGAPVQNARERRPLVYAPTDKERAWATSRLVRDDALVAVAPGAGARAKQWTVEGWAQTMNTLAADRGLGTVLVGGPTEVSLCRAIADQAATSPLVLAGETTLGQLAALFGRCRLVIGADSGPLNLAVAQGVPTVHLFGPADPVQFGPWGPAERHAVVRANLPCMPCRKLDWPLAEDEVTPCLAAVTPADVLAAVARVLG